MRDPAPGANVFAAGSVDRAAERRRDEAWVRERLADPATRLVPLHGDQVLVRGGPAPVAVFVAPDRLSWRDPVLLGVVDGRAHFAVEVTDGPTAAALAAEEAGEHTELRRVGALLAPTEASLLAHARGMLHWHRRHRFCGVCGAPTRAEEAGHLRRCTAAECAAPHFPRVDPAIIVLVTSGDRCLLGRQASWTPGQYATLAGFVEPGESLEDAVAREVREETGVEVREPRYHSSQPWPFPASLMLGFTATATTEAVRADPGELEDARWFGRAELRQAVEAGRVLLPSPVSIAHALIRGWLDA